MKHLSMYLLLIACLASACKKDSSKQPDDPIIDNRPPDEVVETLTEQLSSVEEISIFTNSLKSVSLSKEDVSQGLTIFAPLDQTSGGGSPQRVANRISPNRLIASTSPQKFAETSFDEPGATALTDKELKDHIVKGVYKLTDLTNGMTLTSISGKSLKITKSGNQVWINGVEVGGDAVVSDNKQTIFIVKKPLNNTTVADPPSVTGSIEISVWDATKWATGKPNGELAPGADVILYRSQKDYADNKPAYEGQTGPNGKIKFNSITPGTYYVEVKMGELTNIFNKSAQKVGEVYVGIASESVFQSQAEADSSPSQGGAVPGNFKWIDSNADGLINESDLINLPYQSGLIEPSENAEVSVLIGYINNAAMLPLREDGIRSVLAFTENRIIEFHKNLAMVDGVLSDDDVPPSMFTNPSYASLNNFTFNSSNEFITRVWSNGYNAISDLNRIITDIDALTMSDKQQVLAQAKGLRAYIYMQLYTYFGPIPLQLGINLPTDAENSTKQHLLPFIDGEFDLITANLPQTSANGKIAQSAVSAFRAKLALFDKKYQQAAQHADQVINSGIHQLGAVNSIFEANSPEALWTAYPFSSQYSYYFFERSTWPYIRLTEVYLISAEAHLESGNISSAISRLNPLLSRMGKPTLSQGATVEEIRSTLRQTWKEEMPREGARFANLVRWGTAADTLQTSGFIDPKHRLLPIPQVILDRHSSLRQNNGY